MTISKAKSFHLKTICSDRSEDFQVRITVESQECKASLIVWGTETMFQSFAKDLIAFPSEQKSTEFVWGEVDARHAYFIRIHAELTDAYLIINKVELNIFAVISLYLQYSIKSMN